MHESQTRKEIIDKKLLHAGWDINNSSHATEELDVWIGSPEGVHEPQSKY